MKTLRYIVMTALLAGGTAQAAPGDWNIYMDASAISRVTALGDSLWCGTRGGILLFDLGDSTFTSYLDGLELRSNDITAVTVDGRGSIWAAMRAAGVTRIDDPDGNFSVKEYTEALDGILSDSIMCLLRIEDDIYYGCTRGAAKFFNNVPAPELNLTDSLAGRTVHDMTWDPAGDILWVACGDGIARYDRVTFKCDFYAIGEVLSVCMHEGEVYCVSGPDIRYLGDGSWPALGGSLHMDPVAVASGGGLLYCMSHERAYLWNGIYWESQALTELKNLIASEYRIGWSQNILRTIAVDGGGAPWVGGFYEEGSRGMFLAGSDGTDWAAFRLEGLTQNRIVALDADPSGDIWVSTGRFGISFRSTGDMWTSYTKIRSDVGHDDALSYYVNNLALLSDSQGFLWCNSLTYDLDRIDIGDPLDTSDDIWAHFAAGTGTITSDRFVKAGEDPGGNRWFMSDDEDIENGMWGINIANRAGDDWLTVDPGSHPQMKGGSVFDCAFDDQGAYIALRGYGVMYWRTGGFDWPTLTSTSGDYWITILDEDQLPSTELWSVERGPDGSIWAGTSAGLVRYSQGTIDSFKVKTDADGEGLIGGAVYDIEFDGRGLLWVATNRGLNRIDPDGTITAAYTTTLEWQEELQLIYPPDIISPLPDHSCRALAYDPSGGFIWIGTENGLARFDANKPVEVTQPMSDMILYPNPVHAARGDDALRITRINGPVDIHVYNLEGELVHEVAGVAEGEVAWDLLTINGYQASSGIYMVHVKGAGGTSMRKVAVIR